MIKPLPAACLLGAPRGELVIKGHSICDSWHLDPGTSTHEGETRLSEILAAQANDELYNLGQVAKLPRSKQLLCQQASVSGVQFTTDE